jgi:UDP-N-acetylglucosamine 2-epimerase (hydrolysing)
VGSLNNILVAHIEGGELSGTVDELIRHEQVELSRLHFVVSNDETANGVLNGRSGFFCFFTIGSPDIDIACFRIAFYTRVAKKHYGVDFENLLY